MIDLLTFFFSILAFMILILTLLSIRYVGNFKIRTLVVALFIALLPVSYIAYSDLIGRPKPVEVEWVRSSIEEAKVIGYVLAEDQGIYLYLGIPGEDEPMSYKLPWDRKTAEQIQKAGEKARRQGTDLMVRNPFGSLFEKSLEERERMFYSMPQPKSPDKPRELQAPLEYQGPEEGT